MRDQDHPPPPQDPPTCPPTCIKLTDRLYLGFQSKTFIMNHAETDVLKKKKITVTRNTGIPVSFQHHGLGNKVYEPFLLGLQDQKGVQNCYPLVRSLFPLKKKLKLMITVSTQI